MHNICCFLFQKIHPSWCFYATVLGVILGTVLSVVFNIRFFDHALWLVVAILFMIISIIVPWRIMVVIAILAGMMIANLRVAPEIYAKEVCASLVDQNVSLSGNISDDPNVENGSYKLRLNKLRINFSNDESLDLAGKIYVQLSTKSELKRSVRITLSGKMGAGFGTFYGTLYRPDLIAIERAEHGDIFANIKNNFADLVRQSIPKPEVDLGLGYLVGEKDGLTDEFSKQLRAVGMTHVVVASGAHLGILIGVVRRLFGKISRFAGAMMSILAIMTFILMIGFTPSMTRAALVATFGILAGYVGRSFTPLRMIFLVAAITLLLDPMNLQNLGWQLSFASFFAILVFVPMITKLLYGGKTAPWLASMLITSITTNIICAPILIYNFGTISILSLVANLIILPTLPYAMFLVLCSGILGLVPYVGILIARLATLLLDLHISVVEFLSEQKIFILELPTHDPRFFGIYLILLIWLFWMMLRRVKHRKRLIPAANQKP